MTYDGRTCEDINECVLNNGGCQHSCTNMPGGYKCSCEEGYGLAEDGHSCYDVNECLVNNGGCSQLCRNDEGGRHCECFGGYVLGKDEKTCMGKFRIIFHFSSLNSVIVPCPLNLDPGYICGNRNCLHFASEL
ncbi:EGF-like domain protein [Cooperia oncophora]